LNVIFYENNKLNPLELNKVSCTICSSCVQYINVWYF